MTGLSYDNYIKYEHGNVKEQYMNPGSLQKISDALDIDLMDDYQSFRQHSAETIRNYMKANKLTINKLAMQLGVSATTVKRWRSGLCSPSYDNWIRFFK